MSDQGQTEDWPKIAARWWADLQDVRDGKPNPRAARARLRRMGPDEAIAEEAVLDLYRRLRHGAAGFDERLMRLAVRLALVLVHVRDDVQGADKPPRRFAELIGRRQFDDGKFESAVMKPLRFQQLMAAREEEDVVRAFRRAVDLAGNSANVRDLARVLLHWERDETRTRFAFDYYAAGAAAPADGPGAEPAV